MMINKLTKATLLFQALTRTNPINSIFRTNIANYSWPNNVKSLGFPTSETKSRINLTNDQNNNLWSILKSRTKIKKSSPIEQTIHLCKKITGYYNRVNRPEFIKAEEELYKIVEDIRSMQLGDQPYQTYCNILDFLDVIMTIFGKNANSNNLRDIVFLKFEQSIKIQNMTLGELSRIYASLAKNKYPKLQEVTNIILKSLKKGEKKLESYIIEKIVIGISSRNFLNRQQLQIFQILLLKINQQVKQITPKCIGLTVHLIQSLELRVILREKQILMIIDRLEKHLSLFIQNVKLGDPTLVYFLSLDLKMKKKSIIYEQIWKKVLMSIQTSTQNDLTVKVLTANLQKLYDYHHTKEEKTLIANFMKKSYENKQAKSFVFSNYSAEKTIFNLFEGGLIDSQCINTYNSIVSANTFTAHWNHLQHYTRNNFAFPQKKLQDYLLENKKYFSKPSVLAKAAVIIPFQAKFYPLNEVIEDCNKNIIRIVAEYNWNAQSLDWLLQEIIYDPFIMNIFHKQYQHHYLEKIKKTLIKSNQTALVNYYSYVFEMESKHNIKKQMIQAISQKILLALIFKQHGRHKKRINKLLLSTIVYKINSGSVHFASLFGKEILKLVFLYSNIIWKENQAAVNEYLLLIQSILRYYPSAIPGANEFNLALKRLLRGNNLESQKFHNSIYYLQYLQALNNHWPVMKQKANDQSLLIQVRQQLSLLYPPKPNKQPISKDQSKPKTPIQNIIVQLQQKSTASQQDSAKITSSVKALSFTEIENLIINHLKNKPESQLYHEIISQYIKKFSYEASKNRWKIILFSNIITNRHNQEQFRTLINHIIEKLPLQGTYYKDHLFMLNFITENGLSMHKYKIALYNHLSSNYHSDKHNTAYLALITKLSLYLEFSNQLLQSLLNQMDTNPHNQIKLIAIFYDKIVQKSISKHDNAIFSILDSVVNNSLISLKTSFYLKYFDSVSSQQFKRIFLKVINKQVYEDSFKITKNLTSYDKKILDVLQKKDKVIKEKMLGEDIYIFKKFVLIFSSTESAEVARIIKGALKIKYSLHRVFIFTKSNKKEITDFVNLNNLSNSQVTLSLTDFIPQEVKPATPN